MKVLAVNAAAFVGGAEMWLAALIGRLAHRGYAFEVAHHPSSRLGEIALGAGAAAAWIPHSRFRGVVRTALSLARTAARERYDLVLSTTRSDLVPAGFAARLTGHPGAVARLNSGMSSAESTVSAGWRWRRHRWYHRHLVQLAATNSRAGQLDLVARGFLAPERVEVIYNGVDIDRFDPRRVARGRFREALAIPAGATLAVSIARYAPGRGREAEVEAAVRLAADRPDLHVVFIGSCRPGDEPFRERLARLATGTPGGSRIRFLGPWSDVHEILADADLLIRVMTTEGLANVALEAMAMGVPVVAADISGMPEAIEDGWTGRLVRPADPAAIAGAAAELLDLGADARAAMAERARARVLERFSLDRMADRYAALFTRAARERVPMPSKPPRVG